MQPFNYQLQVQDPFKSVLGAVQLGEGIRSIEASRQQAALAQQRQQLVFQAIEKLHSPDATIEDYRRAALLGDKNQAENVRQLWTQRSEAENKDDLNFTGQVFSAFRAKKPEIARNLLDQKIAALENSGKTESANALKVWRNVSIEDPQSAEDFFGTTLPSIPGGDKVLEGALKVSEARKPEEGFRMLTTKEVADEGLPPGSYQRGPKGEIKPVGREPLVKVDLGQQRSTLAREKLDIPRAIEFSDAAASARKLAQDSRVIANLLKGKGGGGIVKLTTGIQRDFGFESDRVTAADLVNALATRGAVQIRAPGSGATSDLEFKSYLQAFPSLANSERGRELMAKYSEAFAKRSARLADHARKLIREDRYSEEEISRFDDSLGSVLGDDFYEFARPGRRQGVPQFTPPGAAPAAAPPSGDIRSRADEIIRRRNQ